MAKKEVITRSARFEKDVAAMLDLFAKDKAWSANTAMNQALREFLTKLGYDKKI